jgi:hypothetical protein
VTRTLSLYRRAAWGPLVLQASDGRIEAHVPGSSRVVIECPPAHATADPPVLEALRAGIPVLSDGVRRATLRQPERSSSHRRDRKILVEGDPDLVPPGLFLRARWLGSMGLETADSRLVRPRFDVLNAPFLWGAALTVPKVDPAVAPDLLALWGAAEWHLIAAVHI